MSIIQTAQQKKLRYSVGIPSNIQKLLVTQFFGTSFTVVDCRCQLLAREANMVASERDLGCDVSANNSAVVEVGDQTWRIQIAVTYTGS